MGSTRNIAAAVGVAALATLMGAGIAAAATDGSGPAPRAVSGASGTLTAMPGVFHGAQGPAARRSDRDLGDDRGVDVRPDDHGVDVRPDDHGVDVRPDDHGVDVRPDEHGRGRGPGGPGNGGNGGRGGDGDG
jgi:hypothetical protein